MCLFLEREEDPRVGQPAREFGLQSGNQPVKNEPSVELENWSGHVGGGLMLRVSTNTYLFRQYELVH